MHDGLLAVENDDLDGNVVLSFDRPVSADWLAENLRVAAVYSDIASSVELLSSGDDNLVSVYALSQNIGNLVIEGNNVRFFNVVGGHNAEASMWLCMFLRSDMRPMPTQSGAYAVRIMSTAFSDGFFLDRIAITDTFGWDISAVDETFRFHLGYFDTQGFGEYRSYDEASYNEQNQALLGSLLIALYGVQQVGTSYNTLPDFRGFIAAGGDTYVQQEYYLGVDSVYKQLLDWDNVAPLKVKKGDYLFQTKYPISPQTVADNLVLIDSDENGARAFSVHDNGLIQFEIGPQTWKIDIESSTAVYFVSLGSESALERELLYLRLRCVPNVLRLGDSSGAFIGVRSPMLASKPCVLLFKDVDAANAKILVVPFNERNEIYCFDENGDLEVLDIGDNPADFADVVDSFASSWFDNVADVRVAPYSDDAVEAVFHSRTNLFSQEVRDF